MCSSDLKEEQLSSRSDVDELTGEMNRNQLTEALESAINQATSQRTSCGFILAAIDNLAQINESYGVDVADEAIAAVAKRLRSKMRGGDRLGRVSGNKFGVLLNNCTPDDIVKAAERFTAGVRDDVVRTSAGPVAITISAGCVTAPRHAASVHEVLGRAQETLDRAKARRLGSFQVFQPSLEREAMRRENIRVADEIVVDLMARACGVDYADAKRDAVEILFDGVPMVVASPRTLIRTKDTFRPSDAADRQFLQALIDETAK